MFRWVCSGLLLFCFVVASNSVAATIHVPADQPTIQAGINAAADGDKVPVASASPQGGASVLFSDDFENGLNPLWTTKGDCTWEVTGGEVRTSLTGYEKRCSLIAQNTTWTDYIFEYDVRGNAGVDKDVIFRYDGNQGYCFSIRSDWTGDEAYLAFAGHPYAQIVNFPSQNGVWYHVEITCQGNHIVIKVDGATIIDYVDTSNSCPSGGIRPLLLDWYARTC
jgi:hypothetical protein